MAIMEQEVLAGGIERMDNELTRPPKLWLNPSYVSFWVKYTIGRVLTRLGVPGFVREGEYEGFGKRVKVSIGGLYTVITVDGISIDICRYTGKITGMGFMCVDHCKQGDTP
ncbi:MAG: hypothetical protein OXI94_08325 [Gemmatimonadota bacterium]|nr:hypothetical protein [Gemmatimonadota bacterium]